MEFPSTTENIELPEDESRDNLIDNIVPSVSNPNPNVGSDNQQILHILNEEYNIKFINICNFFETCIKAKAKSKIKSVIFNKNLLIFKIFLIFNFTKNFKKNSILLLIS
jgi:hypothetical protein